MKHYTVDIGSDFEIKDLKAWFDQAGTTLAIKDVATGERIIFQAALMQELKVPKNENYRTPAVLAMVATIAEIKAAAAPRLLTADSIAAELNRRQIKTLKTGVRWTGTKVQLFMDRHEVVAAKLVAAAGAEEAPAT